MLKIERRTPLLHSKYANSGRKLKFLGPKKELKEDYYSVVPAFLTVGSGANSLTVTLGNIHCIQRLTFPLLPPMLLVFCSRVTVSANGPSSPGGTESPWRDKQDLVKELGWCDVVGSIKHQHQPVRSKNVHACMTVLTLVGRADQGSASKPKGFWQRLEGDSTALFIFLILFSCKSAFLTSFCVVSSPKEKSCNLTIWKCAALE